MLSDGDRAWRPSWGDWARTALRAVIAVVALYPIVRFTGIALERIRYPFELEWMEGGVVSHVRAVLGGGAIYREPSIEFAPFIYAPLYYYVSAAFSAVMGLGYFAPRLVSLISIVLAFALVGVWVRRVTRDAVAGLAAAGLFAATYGVTGFWFDLARVDPLFLALVLGGYVTALRAETPRAAAAAAVLLAAGAWTKQPGLALAVPGLLHLALRSKRLGLWGAAVFGAVALGGFLVFDVLSHGWARYYLFELPSHHEILWRDWQTVLNQHFWTPIPLMALGGLAVLCGLGCVRSAWKVWLVHSAFVLVACGSSFVSLLHVGGYPNTLLPAYAALAIACGIQLAELFRFHAEGALPAFGRGVLALLALGLQFVLLGYEPAAAVPTPEDRRAGQRVLGELARLPRPLWVTASSHYPVLAGQRDGFAPAMALTDVLRVGGPVPERLRHHLIEQIRSRRFRTIVLDRASGFLPPDLVSEIRGSYRFTGRLFRTAADAAFWPKSGAAVRPDEVWQARD